MNLHVARFAILILLLCVCLSSSRSDDSFLVAGKAKDLVAILQSDAGTYDKAKACQQLGVVGDDSSVAALARLVDDPKLSGYALTALSRIPGPQADQVMVENVKRLGGRQLVGLLHAVGQRHLESAVPAIGQRVESGNLDELEVQAAVGALGSIATPEATQILRQVKLDGASGLTKRLHADALAKCAVRQSRRQSNPTADQLQRLEGAADADEPNFARLLMEARSMGPAASPILAKQLTTLPPRRQALVLICLADLGIPAGLEVTRSLIDSDDAEVAVRAVETLAALGGLDNEREMPGFVRARPELASRWINAIAGAANEKIDADVVGTLMRLAAGGQAQPLQVQIALIQYAGQRRLSGATPPLLQLASSDDKQIRQAALAAAGLTVNSQQFPDLIACVSKQRDDPEIAIDVLQRACVHLPQEAAAKSIAAALDGADDDTRSLLLEQLAFLGGPTALRIVTDYAAGDEESQIDAATKVLGEWMTADVAAPLMKLSDDLPPGKYQLRALRGYLRVGRQLDMPSSDRLELCKNGLQRAQRDDERILVLDIIRRFPSQEAFTWLCQLLRENEFDSRAVTNRAFTTLAHAADRVALSDPAAVSSELSTLDLTRAPAPVRATLESRR